MSVRVRFPSRAHSSPCTVFFVHGFFCSRFFCARFLVHGFFVCGFLCAVSLYTASLCGFWSVSASRLFPMMLRGTPAHPGRDTAGQCAMAEILLVGAPIGRTVSKCHHQGAPSGRNYWQGASTNHHREKLTGKSAQKCQFCARKVGIGTRERGNWHREAQPLPSCKSPSTLSKCKCLITR